LEGEKADNKWWDSFNKRMPNLLYIVPIGDDTMLDWVFQSKYPSFELHFITREGEQGQTMPMG